MEKTVDIVYIVDEKDDESFEAIRNEVVELVSIMDKFIKHSSSFDGFTVKSSPKFGRCVGSISNGNGRTVQFRVISTLCCKPHIINSSLAGIKELQDPTTYISALRHLGLGQEDFGPQASMVIVPCLSGKKSSILVEAVAKHFSKQSPYAVLNSVELDGQYLCDLAERLQCRYELTNGQIDKDYLRLSRRFLKGKGNCLRRLLGGYLSIAAVFFGVEQEG